MLEVWGRTNSVNVKKVLWTLEELGLPYLRHDAGGAFGVVATPAYRAMNPNGLVPTLVDGAFTLWESHAIVRYLAAKYGDGRLISADPARRAKAEQWMDWVHSFGHPFRDVIVGLVRTPPEKRDLAAIERGRQACADLFAIADGALSAAPWLGGDEFGVADVALGPYAHVWYELPIDRPALPHLEAWYARLQSRPAFGKVVAIPLS